MKIKTAEEFKNYLRIGKEEFLKPKLEEDPENLDLLVLYSKVEKALQLPDKEIQKAINEEEPLFTELFGSLKKVKKAQDRFKKYIENEFFISEDDNLVEEAMQWYNTELKRWLKDVPYILKIDSLVKFNKKTQYEILDELKNHQVGLEKIDKDLINYIENKINKKIENTHNLINWVKRNNSVILYVSKEDTVEDIELKVYFDSSDKDKIPNEVLNKLIEYQSNLNSNGNFFMVGLTNDFKNGHKIQKLDPKIWNELIFNLKRIDLSEDMKRLNLED